MNTINNKPIATLRDGKLKATIWSNQRSRKPDSAGDPGVFYSVDLARSYQDDQGNWHDSHSFSGSEPLQIARLADQAYDRIAELRRDDAAAMKSHEQAA